MQHRMCNILYIIRLRGQWRKFCWKWRIGDLPPFVVPEVRARQSVVRIPDIFISVTRRNPLPTVQDRQPLNCGKVAVMCHESCGTHVERSSQVCRVG